MEIINGMVNLNTKYMPDAKLMLISISSIWHIITTKHVSETQAENNNYYIHERILCISLACVC